MKPDATAKFHGGFMGSCVIMAAMFLTKLFHEYQTTDGWVQLVQFGLVTSVIIIGCIDGLVHHRHTDEIPNFIFGFMLGNIMMWTS